jgi:hypothetical protein
MTLVAGTQKAPHPEDTALRLTLEQSAIVHNRLNYWLVTEGLLFMAIAALLVLLQKTPDNASWFMIYVLSSVGLSVTALWQAVIMRADSVQNWYSSRLHAIHWETHGKPKGAFDAQSRSVLPDWKVENLLRGNGLDIAVGSSIMSVMFAIAWVSLAVYSAMQFNNISEGSLRFLAGCPIFLLIVYSEFLFYSYHARTSAEMMDKKKSEGPVSGNGKKHLKTMHFIVLFLSLVLSAILLAWVVVRIVLDAF